MLTTVTLPRNGRQKMTCFNCGGPHMLSACKEPKDYGRIAKKRREFNEANPNSRPQQQPSSTDLSSNMPLVSFDHFKPGNIRFANDILYSQPHSIFYLVMFYDMLLDCTQTKFRNMYTSFVSLVIHLAG